jgi:hypothetical protein
MAKGFKTGGRRPGIQNRVTTMFKQAVSIVYENIGGHAAFTEWAMANPTEFYRIAARLIPAETATADANHVTVVINRGYDLEQEDTPSLPYHYQNPSVTDHSC